LKQSDQRFGRWGQVCRELGISSGPTDSERNPTNLEDVLGYLKTGHKILKCLTYTIFTTVAKNDRAFCRLNTKSTLIKDIKAVVTYAEAELAKALDNMDDPEAAALGDLEKLYKNLICV